eukprot:c18962_g1_i4.p1 GENE.c18962_g1_i4~~c18962_g1_i4.p1  ORF type:complete len:431 (+),score=84.77 c18962_g1_i4:496-1788(+)
MGLAVGAIRSAATNKITNAVKSPSDRAPSISSPASAVLTDENLDRIASTLCRMRGAALKLGQMLSIQDEGMVPPKLLQVLNRVRASADIMPKTQLDRVLEEEWGRDWRKNFLEFSEIPFASASIGQVHRGVLTNGQVVAVKVQYPGVAESIDSDLLNLKRIATMTSLIPKGLYIDNVMEVVKIELSRECNYQLEALNQIRTKALLASDPDFVVPSVIGPLSTRRVITSEFLSGGPLDKTFNLSQDLRNHIAALMLRLTLRELFEFRFMQTDPNWSNFLFPVDAADGDTRLRIIDFGASIEYGRNFVDKYRDLVMACANRDREKILQVSQSLGLLTGEETRTMKDAHVEASYVVGEPFATSEPYDFAKANLTARITKLAKVMLEHRLTPPPQEVYSLHRKLSGCFLLCIRLRAKIECRNTLLDIYHASQVS